MDQQTLVQLTMSSYLLRSFVEPLTESLEKLLDDKSKRKENMLQFLGLLQNKFGELHNKVDSFPDELVETIFCVIAPQLRNLYETSKVLSENANFTSVS